MGWVDVTEPYAAPPRLPDELASSDALGPGDDEQLLSLERCRLVRLDLSRRRITELLQCELVECKLTGTDLSGARIEDTAFDGCTFSYTNLRMAQLERVRVSGCVLDEVDAYESQFVDVEFADSRLTSLDVAKVRAERVDLRHARELGLRAVGRLDGWLVSESQLPAMMYALAAGAGLGIERVEEP